MRIIGGRFRGKKLEFIKDENTRPTRDFVRENMFNVLGSAIRGAVVLDLFAGSGSFGLEALSRGAASVTFIEKNPAASAVIRRNIHAINQECAHVVNDDVFAAMMRLKDEKFDIIFADPPYNAQIWPRLVDAIFAYNLPSEKCVVICELGLENLDGFLSIFSCEKFSDFELKVKNYGRTSVVFLSK